MSDTGTTEPKGMSARLESLIRKAIMDERELTKKEQGELDRGLRGHVDGVSAKLQQQLDALGMSIKDVVDFVADQKKRQEDADKVKDNANTIVVPPSTIKPVVPEETEPVATATGERPRRSWKDWL